MGAAARDEEVSRMLRLCLNKRGGSFNPAKICHRSLDKEMANGPRVHQALDGLLHKGGLRPFIDQHPEFHWEPLGEKGMRITWGVAPGSASADNAPGSASAAGSAQALPSSASAQTAHQALPVQQALVNFAHAEAAAAPPAAALPATTLQLSHRRPDAPPAAADSAALWGLLGDDRQLSLRRRAAVAGAPEPEPLTLASGAGGGGPGVPAEPPQQQRWQGLGSTMTWYERWHDR